jgi:hypothetical protein
MPRVGFEPTVPVLERAKGVDTVDRAATVKGIKFTHVIRKGLRMRILIVPKNPTVTVAHRFNRRGYRAYW